MNDVIMTLQGALYNSSSYQKFSTFPCSLPGLFQLGTIIISNISSILGRFPDSFRHLPNVVLQYPLITQTLLLRHYRVNDAGSGASSSVTGCYKSVTNFCWSALTTSNVPLQMSRWKCNSKSGHRFQFNQFNYLCFKWCTKCFVCGLSASSQN